MTLQAEGLQARMGTAQAAGTLLVRMMGVIKRRVAKDRSFELVIPDLEVRAGEAVAFIGPSGSGKSTLIDLLAMTLRPDEARDFSFFTPGEQTETDLVALWRSRKQDTLGQIRSRYFGYVLQTGGLLPFLSVRDNIRLPQRLLGFEDAEWIDTLARRLGFAEQMTAKPGQLSVGQRQRVAIARALAHKPAIVLADEPTASLDPVNAHGVMDLFMELIDRSGSTLIIVSHDSHLVDRFKIPLIEGQVSQRGATARSVFGGAPSFDTDRTVIMDRTDQGERVQ